MSRRASETLERRPSQLRCRRRSDRLQCNVRLLSLTGNAAAHRSAQQLADSSQYADSEFGDDPQWPLVFFDHYERLVAQEHAAEGLVDVRPPRSPPRARTAASVAALFFFFVFFAFSFWLFFLF